MNNNPNNGRQMRPERGRTSPNAAKGGEISVLSAILTGRRSRAIACLVIALVTALSAVVTVAASIAASYRNDADGERSVISASNDTADNKDTAISTEPSADKTGETEKNRDTDAATDTDKTADTDKDEETGKTKDTEKEEDTKKEEDPKKEEDTEKAKDPNVHTVRISFYDKEDVVSDTMAKTLGDFILYSGITLTDVQLANLDLDTKITSDMTFSADRITFDTITEDETIPFETQYRDSTEIAAGTQSVAQAGSNGVLTRAFDVKYVNGVEVYREQKGAWVSVEAVDQIILQGVETQQTGETTVPSNGSGAQAAANGLPASTVYESGYVTGADGVSRHYYAYIDVQATVYNAGGTTAYGLPADENVMGVGRYDGTMTPIIPFGTRCYVMGAYGDCGERISADYGNMFGNKIDLCMYPSNPLYNGFGWRAMRVYILG